MQGIIKAKPIGSPLLISPLVISSPVISFFWLRPLFSAAGDGGRVSGDVVIESIVALKLLL